MLPNILLVNCVVHAVKKNLVFQGKVAERKKQRRKEGGKKDVCVCVCLRGGGGGWRRVGLD